MDSKLFTEIKEDAMTAKWDHQTEMTNACNSEWRCSSNFNAKPTTGSCEEVGAAHITSGQCSDTQLGGAKFPWGARWTGAVHEGRAMARIWIDDSISEDQCHSAVGILQGLFEGMPRMIIASTVDHWFDTAYAPCGGTYDGA